MLLNERRAGLCGGMVFSMIPLISIDEIFRTIVLGITGATVSFGVSYILQRLLSGRQQGCKKKDVAGR